MSKEQDLRIAALEQQIRDRDVADLKVKAEAMATANAEDAAKFDAAAAEAAAKHRDQIRRGSWVKALLAKADQSAPLDALALAKLIPEGDLWPEGVDADQFKLTISAAPKALPDITNTTIGQLLQGGFKS